ncbi:MAG: tetratricopeptide repeat protein [Bacteroidetes bacterium]|nr:tetratricopeptide repeat protein [Bacteroidota bacterium]
MKKYLIGLLLLCSGISFAANPELTIAKANKAYSDGYYANAVELYKSVIAGGDESVELYYNLGNACYKLNDFAAAILYYEKARKLDPGNEDVNFNLRIVNTKITDKIEPLPELFYKRWYRGLVESYSVDKWARIGLFSLVLGLIAGLFYVISRHLFIRKAGFWIGVILVLMSILSFLFAWQGYDEIKNRKNAIIFTPTVTIKSSPDEKSIDLFVLHEGAKVELMDNIGGWYEIRIANGSIGWLPASSVERI